MYGHAEPTSAHDYGRGHSWKKVILGFGSLRLRWEGIHLIRPNREPD